MGGFYCSFQNFSLVSNQHTTVLLINLLQAFLSLTLMMNLTQRRDTGISIFSQDTTCSMLIFTEHIKLAFFHSNRLILYGCNSTAREEALSHIPRQQARKGRIFSLQSNSLPHKDLLLKKSQKCTQNILVTSVSEPLILANGPSFILLVYASQVCLSLEIMHVCSCEILKSMKVSCYLYRSLVLYLQFPFNSAVSSL